MQQIYQLKRQSKNVTRKIQMLMANLIMCNFYFNINNFAFLEHKNKTESVYNGHLRARVVIYLLYANNSQLIEYKMSRVIHQQVIILCDFQDLFTCPPCRTYMLVTLQPSLETTSQYMLCTHYTLTTFSYLHKLLHAKSTTIMAM